MVIRSEGDLVDVYDNKDTFLAVGHYAPSSIAVRVLSFEQVTPDINFLQGKDQKSYNIQGNSRDTLIILK